MILLEHNHLSDYFLVKLLSPSNGFVPGDQVLFSSAIKPRPDDIVVLASAVGSPLLMTFKETGPETEKGADVLGTVIEVCRLGRGFIPRVLKDQQDSLNSQANPDNSELELLVLNAEISVALAEVRWASSRVFPALIALMMTWSASPFLILFLGRSLI